jgi:hypothetical protein
MAARCQATVSKFLQVIASSCSGAASIESSRYISWSKGNGFRHIGHSFSFGPTTGLPRCHRLRPEDGQAANASCIFHRGSDCTQLSCLLSRGKRSSPRAWDCGGTCSARRAEPRAFDGPRQRRIRPAASSRTTPRTKPLACLSRREIIVHRRSLLLRRQQKRVDERFRALVLPINIVDSHTIHQCRLHFLGAS